MTAAMIAHLDDDPHSGEPVTAPRPEADAATLRGIVQRLAEEASTLGVDLVDIAGAIQDVAGISKRHAVTFDGITRTARKKSAPRSAASPSRSPRSTRSPKRSARSPVRPTFSP